jgi:biotin operon repressor
MLESGKVASRAELARNLGISRARVAQVLRLLRLDPEVLESVVALGDPLPSPVITERRLRSLVDLPANKQIQWIGRWARQLIIEKTSE